MTAEDTIPPAAGPEFGGPPGAEGPATMEGSPEPTPAEVPTGPRWGLPPLAYPVIALLMTGILVFSFSRILLAVSKDAAAAIAIFTAVNILIGAALVAYGRRVRRRPAAFPLLILAGVGIVALGIAAMGLPKPAAEGGGRVEAVTLVASGLAFDASELSFAPGADIKMAFDNQDAGIQHNFVLTSDASGSGVLFRGDLITGVASATYTFTVPPPGAYFFHCEVHPTMKGTVSVGAPGGPSGGGGPEGGTAALVASNLAFQPTQLSAKGGGTLTISFDNRDAGITHNFALFSDEARTKLIFRGDLVTGLASKDYTFPSPPPGTYYFHCDVHPNMQGTLAIT